MKAALLIPIQLVALALSGCASGADPEPAGRDLAIPWGAHPWPSGDEWPAGLEGPFELLGIDHVRVASFDGIELDGWILRPATPDDVKVPIVLWSAPYFGQCSYLQVGPPSCAYATGDQEELRDGDLVSEAVPIDFLIEHGYAVAVFNVRGTGNSGGCFEWFGPNEQKDQALLVEWLADQPWSNGRVAMQGLSYHGTTPWEAAIQNPPALKTIVVAGMIGDAYTFSHTPQGAKFTTIGVFATHFAWRVSLSPPIQGGPEHATIAHAHVVPDRACPEVVKAVTEDVVGLSDVRNQQFWDARRLIDRFPEVTAAVFLTHGFQDHHGSGHQQQENAVWNTLTKAPKRQLEGQWGHQFPNHNSINADWAMDDWYERLLEWYDFWLKGIGDAPPREGLVDYQDDTGAWHVSTGWPPAEAREEVMYLVRDTLAPTPGPGDTSFRSVPEATGPRAQFCPDRDAALSPTGATGHVYWSEAAAETMLLAGNPMALLTIRSDLPGGLVAIHLYEVAPDDACADGARLWAAGVADLRFHRGGFEGRDFPTRAPAHLRIDITNFAEVLEEGNRLAAVVSYGNPIDRTGQPFTPTLDILSGDALGSHLVLPFVNGTFGGSPPTIDYPPRPFVPQV